MTKITKWVWIEGLARYATAQVYTAIVTTQEFDAIIKRVQGCHDGHGRVGYVKARRSHDTQNVWRVVILMKPSNSVCHVLYDPLTMQPVQWLFVLPEFNLIRVLETYYFDEMDLDYYDKF